MQLKAITVLTALILSLWTLYPGKFTIVPNSQAFVQSPKASSISIHGKRSNNTMTNVKVQPFDKIYITKPTRVRWHNNSDTPILIKFGKGDKCESIIGAAPETTSWRPSQRCYLTANPISPKGTLRILFNQSGNYNFEIQFVGTKTTTTGVLIVHA
jgi:hypothetical protein